MSFINSLDILIIQYLTIKGNPNKTYNYKDYIKQTFAVLSLELCFPPNLIQKCIEKKNQYEYYLIHNNNKFNNTKMANT